MFEHFLVRKPDDAQTFPRHPIRPLRVVLFAFVVRVAIHFHDQLRRMAEEVSDAAADAVLSAEADAKLVAAEFLPELQFASVRCWRISRARATRVWRKFSRLPVLCVGTSLAPLPYPSPRSTGKRE